jgi:hypothetical protein
MADNNNDEADPPEMTMDACIERLLLADPALVKANAKTSSYSLAQVKGMAAYLKLSQSKSKSDIVDSIYETMARKKELNAIELKAAGGDSFRKNKDTIPRIINILVASSDLLQADGLASRMSLQAKEVNESKPVYVEGAAKFNDANYNSGSSPSFHQIYDEKDIQTERENTSGKLSCKKMFDLFKIAKKDYSKAHARWTASGHHAGDDFWDFCHGNVESLWMFEVLKSIGDIQLSAYCKEACEVEGGLDSGATATALPPITPAGRTNTAPGVSSKKEMAGVLSSLSKSIDGVATSRTKEKDKELALVNSEMADKVKMEHRVISNTYISDLETKIERIEEADGYNCDAEPSRKLKRLRSELDNVSESFGIKFH